MTLIENLKQAGDGEIYLPAVCLINGKEQDGTSSEEILSTKFADFVNKEVPLSDADFQNLLDISPENWDRIWTRAREQGLI